MNADIGGEAASSTGDRVHSESASAGSGGAVAGQGIAPIAALQEVIARVKSRRCFIETTNQDCATLLLHADQLRGVLDTSTSLTRESSQAAFDVAS